jgi:hypothetical protein
VQLSASEAAERLAGKLELRKSHLDTCGRVDLVQTTHELVVLILCSRTRTGCPRTTSETSLRAVPRRRHAKTHTRPIKPGISPAEHDIQVNRLTRGHCEFQELFKESYPEVRDG